MHLHVGIQLVAWLSGTIPAIVLGYALGSRRRRYLTRGAYLLGYRAGVAGDARSAETVVALLSGRGS